MIFELVFLMAFSTNGVSGYAPDEVCPVAVFNVRQFGPKKYVYGVSYTMPAEGYHPVRYIWRVSDGKILGSQRSRQIVVDTSSVKAQTVTVTLKIHWKNLRFLCDRTLTDTIHLRQ
jgi:hypothetical protein